jgi:hypothetical protein
VDSGFVLEAVLATCLLRIPTEGDGLSVCRGRQAHAHALSALGTVQLRLYKSIPLSDRRHSGPFQVDSFVRKFFKHLGDGDASGNKVRAIPIGGKKGQVAAGFGIKDGIRTDARSRHFFGGVCLRAFDSRCFGFYPGLRPHGSSGPCGSVHSSFAVVLDQAHKVHRMLNKERTRNVSVPNGELCPSSNTLGPYHAITPETCKYAINIAYLQSLGIVL